MTINNAQTAFCVAYKVRCEYFLVNRFLLSKVLSTREETSLGMATCCSFIALKE
jgi:hypothetical protein